MSQRSGATHLPAWYFWPYLQPLRIQQKPQTPIWMQPHSQLRIQPHTLRKLMLGLPFWKKSLPLRSAGDVVLFTMHSIHGSSVNCTDRYRLSMDFRVRAERVSDVEQSQKKGRPE